MFFLTCLSRYTCTRAEKCPSDAGNKLWYQTCQIWGHRVPSCLPAKGPLVQSTLLSLLLLQSLLSKQLTYRTGLMVVSRENSKPEAFPCQDKKWVEKTEGRRIQPGAEETTAKKQRQTESHHLVLLSVSKSSSTHTAPLCMDSVPAAQAPLQPVVPMFHPTLMLQRCAAVETLRWP